MTHARSRIGGLACLLSMAFGIPAAAVAAGCSLSSSGLAFGAYQPLTFSGRFSSVAVTSDASISVVCTGIAAGGSYTIMLGPSTAGTGDRITTRYLQNAAGGNDMSFNIYREPSHSTVWGDGITAGSPLSGTIPAGDSNQSLAVYGRIPGGQNTLKAGQFSGVLTMTISFSP